MIFETTGFVGHRPGGSAHTNGLHVGWTNLLLVDALDDSVNDFHHKCFSSLILKIDLKKSYDKIMWHFLYHEYKAFHRNGVGRLGAMLF
jgi:hypothetical protein